MERTESNGTRKGAAAMDLEGEWRPAVSIVIPCRNEVGSIRACVEGAVSQEDPGRGIEVIVADGGSDDGTAEVLRELAASDSRIRLVENPGGFAASGLNRAIEIARGDIVVRMDAHTEYAPDYVRTCVETLGSTGADNVGGPARTKARTFWERAAAAAYHSPFAVGGARFHDIEFEGPVDTVTYGCWSRAAFLRYGPFEEELARNQDDEHNFRIVKAGGVVWQNPRIRSYYRPRSSPRAVLAQYAQYGFWKVRVILKHGQPASWRHLVPGLFVGSLLALPALALITEICLVGAREMQVGQSLFAGLGTTRDLALWAWLSLLTGYAGCLGWASVHAARKAGLELLAALPWVIACYHLGYGWGFLRGLWRFVVRKAGATHVDSTLTR